MRANLLICITAIALCIGTTAQAGDCDLSDGALRDMRPPDGVEFIKTRFSGSDYTCAIHAARIHAASLAGIPGVEGIDARFALRETALELSCDASYPSEKRLALLEAAAISQAGGAGASLKAEQQADVAMIYAAASQFKAQKDVSLWLDALILAMRLDRQLPDDARRIPLW